MGCCGQVSENVCVWLWQTQGGKGFPVCCCGCTGVRGREEGGLCVGVLGPAKMEEGGAAGGGWAVRWRRKGQREVLLPLPLLVVGFKEIKRRRMCAAQAAAAAVGLCIGSAQGRNLRPRNLISG